jgi:hypothetical protein
MRDSALFGFVEVHFNGQENRMSHTRSTWCLKWMMRLMSRMYHLAQRTVTDNQVQQFYASPNRESFVQREGEYHTVKDQCAAPCDSTDWFLELLVNKESVTL